MNDWLEMYQNEILFSQTWMGENAIDFDSAISRALELKADGWDLFRGQARCQKLAPTVRRGETQQTNFEKLEAFVRWVYSKDALSEMHGNSMQIFTIAQHYGLETGLLDFSSDPNVAGFFAQHDSLESAATAHSSLLPSCIVCAKSEKISELLEYYASRSLSDDPTRNNIEGVFPVSGFGRADVQSSVMVQTSFNDYDIDIALDFHRIYFPPVSGRSIYQYDDMFPKAQSQLEKWLEQYFTK